MWFDCSEARKTASSTCCSGGDPSGHPNLLRIFDFPPSGALARGQNLIRHVGITAARRHAVDLHVMLAHFLGDAFDETHQRGLGRGVEGKIRPAFSRSAAGDAR